MFVKWIKLNYINRESRAHSLEASRHAVQAPRPQCTSAYLNGVPEVHKGCLMTPAAPARAPLPHAVTPAAPHKLSASPALSRPAPGRGGSAGWTHGGPRFQGEGQKEGAKAWRGEALRLPRFPPGSRGRGGCCQSRLGAGEREEILMVRCVFPGAAGGICGCPEGRVVGSGGGHSFRGEVWAGRTWPRRGGGG